MKVLRILLLAIAALATGLLAEAAPGDEARVIVRFKADADSVKVRRLQARMSRAEVMDVAQTRATGLGLRHGLSGGRLKARMSLDERTHVVVASGLTSAQLVQKLSADGEVELVVVDGIRKRAAVPNDPLFGDATPNLQTTSGGIPARVIDQWYLKAPTAATAVNTSDVVSSINAPAAWDITKGSASVVVAVIDTGVRFEHPDLTAQFISTTGTAHFPGGFVGYDFVAYKLSTSVALATANDGNGADSDASDPGDWVSQSDITSNALGTSCTSDDIDDSSWHGTRVSGLIGAIANNGIGMAGVAWNSKILPVRVLGKCGGYDSDIMAGMLWAAGISVPGVPDNPNPAKVLNMSLGGAGACTGSGSGTYPGTISQVIAAGATVVVAAGNGDATLGGLATSSSTPASCPGVIAVAALRHAGSKVGFSNVGPEVSIAAPGGNCINTASNQPCLYTMVSTINLGMTGPGLNGYTGNSSSVGTSFSAPLVSGTVALMLAVNPTLTPAKVKSILQATARPFPTGGATAGTQQCTVPRTGTGMLECYCTTDTCGAGMLDAAAAVASAAGSAGSVTISTSPTSPTAGQTLTLTGNATLASGRTVASWAWTLTSGGGAVTAFTGATNAAIATLSPTAAGTISVKVQATDDLGSVYEATSSIVVAAAATSGNSTTGSSSSGGGGGGGGAVNPLWLLGLMLAAVALMRRQGR